MSGDSGRISLNTCDMDGDGGPLPKSHIMDEPGAEENEALVKRWRENSRVKRGFPLRQILVEYGRAADWDVRSWAEELDTAIHTHLSEGTYEVDYTMENYTCGHRSTSRASDLQ